MVINYKGTGETLPPYFFRNYYMKLYFKQLYKDYINWYWNWQHEYDAEWMTKYYKDLDEVYYTIVDKFAPFFLCLCYFHEPVDDHCMKPEHRYCWKCQTLTPNQNINEGW